MIRASSATCHRISRPPKVTGDVVGLARATVQGVNLAPPKECSVTRWWISDRAGLRSRRRGLSRVRGVEGVHSVDLYAHGRPARDLSWHLRRWSPTSKIVLKSAGRDRANDQTRRPTTTTAYSVNLAFGRPSWQHGTCYRIPKIGVGLVVVSTVDVADPREPGPGRRAGGYRGADILPPRDDHRDPASRGITFRASSRPG